MIRVQLLIAGFLVLAVFGAAGCATTGTPQVPADKPSIAQIQRIGTFTWHGQPFYKQNVGHGILGIGASIGQAIFSSVSGESGETIRAISNSGVYETFEQKLVQRLSTQLTKNVEILNKENYAHTGTGNDRRVDALASAKSQGYDALLEITVWPSLYEQMNGINVTSAEATLSIRLTLTRVADAKVLWNTSYKTWKSGNDVGLSNLTGLVPKAVDYAIELYASGK